MPCLRLCFRTKSLASLLCDSRSNQTLQLFNPVDHISLLCLTASCLQLVTAGAGWERGDQTVLAAAGCAEDLPEYAEIAPEPPDGSRPTQATAGMVDNQLYGLS